jgi:drug/metabolite transporter (DMT)-like permease
MAQGGDGRETGVPARADDPLRGILLQLCAIALFSISDALSKKLGETLPAVEVAWLRFLVFFLLVLVPLMRRGGLGLLRSRRPGLQVVRAIGVVGSALCFIAGLSHLPLAEATAINFVSPIFITVLSVPILGEVVGWRRWTALAVGLMGALIVIRPGTEAFQLAALFPVASASCWAVAAVITRRMAGVDPPNTTLVWTAGGGLLLLTLLAPFGTRLPTWPELWLGLAIGVVATAAQSLVVLAYRVAPASALAPVSYTQLITSGLLGLALFGAVPDGWTLVGAGIIAASGLYTAHRERVRARAARR